MHLVALTGGIASGKSLVAARLAELGAVLVDADVLAREVVEPGSPALAAIADAFGPSVIATDGSLDRAALGAIVFSDDSSRELLNSITHPAVWNLAEERFARADEADPSAVVVYDVPLLAERSSHRPFAFDRIVVVEAPEETRIARMIRDRGMTRAEALARIAAQATDEQRRALADLVIDNGGSREHTLEQVDALWGTLKAAAKEAPQS
ncbi:dephospho-CoA kinase [Microbacteriaceae bacterium SG_E_30_P1]|uniref:Dephospho-CoA kinase n=1 Tax=Antiquaquibacter oligotrophicus TaxID=2880260 RepID=A0ABT6KNB8_9MICO|nr:dephospho-CoA kinase [Antiquaquibacter oligotrophicus]MDH6180938.1 dephospho-CoA kinase [Antiquaquibacter oligotrophicus]UDF13359.1 dephospho-CoA kinase [Antiquaquibacter oligotrophicus]